MLLTRLLNACHHVPGFVYAAARLIEATSTIEIDVRPRRRCRPRCSCCGNTAAGYDLLPIRRFEFIPIWGYTVELLYCMRRVQCRQCGVKVEQALGHRQAQLDQGVHAVPGALGAQAVVEGDRAELSHDLGSGLPGSGICRAMGLEHRELGSVRAIGVDEIQLGRGHHYLTLVYQIEVQSVRLLWVGKERTTQGFEQFFTLIGRELAAKIEFVCSDMWLPYLQLIAKHCTQALNILDRFHVVAKLNLALDDVRAAEARRMAREGYEPVLKNKRWCLLKRPENLTDNQRMSLRELLGYNLKSVRAYLLKEEFQQFWDYDSPAWAAKYLD